MQEVEGTPIEKPTLVAVKMDSKTAKYFLNVKKGMNKRKAAKEAGYVSLNNTSKIEASKQFQAVVHHYKDALLDKMSLSEIAEEHIKNIRQDTDRGAKNTAIKMAYEKIEPEKVTSSDDDKVMVVLKMN